MPTFPGTFKMPFGPFEVLFNAPFGLEPGFFKLLDIGHELSLVWSDVICVGPPCSQLPVELTGGPGISSIPQFGPGC